MSWTYRVFRRNRADEAKDPYYVIHELHDGMTATPNWTEDAITPCGETPLELSNDLEYMRAALSQPVLEEHDGHLHEVEPPPLAQINDQPDPTKSKYMVAYEQRLIHHYEVLATSQTEAEDIVMSTGGPHGLKPELVIGPGWEIVDMTHVNDPEDLDPTTAI